jgi:hypothetical protein
LSATGMPLPQKKSPAGPPSPIAAIGSRFKLAYI